mmetsp:Transcript_41394/g.125332  ORF Transcript_41394/g.125332 Transcript_41394/m.125332 type:complete len:113 (-) Transcript_41394:1664-2002(-)
MVGLPSSRSLLLSTIRARTKEGSRDRFTKVMMLRLPPIKEGENSSQTRELEACDWLRFNVVSGACVATEEESEDDGTARETRVSAMWRERERGGSHLGAHGCSRQRDKTQFS